MSRYLQRKFALSEQGGKDLTKAIFFRVLTNTGLMFPMGILLVLPERLLGLLVGIEASVMGMVGYMGISAPPLVVIPAVERLQYNTTLPAFCKESAQMRIRLAKRPRTLPLSLFGRRDLADLTTTITADCAFAEKVFSHFILELIDVLISTMLIGIGFSAADWRMGLAVLWVVPVPFLLAAGTRPMVDRMERRQEGRGIVAPDGIQECIENVQDIKANNQKKEYLKGPDRKLLNMESIIIRLELLNGTLVTVSQTFPKIGMVTTVLAGASLLVPRSIDSMIFLMLMLAATRLHLLLAGCLQNLPAMYSTLLVVERMKGIEE